MKTTTLYTCELCGTQYSDRNTAASCEKNHKKPCEFVSCRYLPMKQNQPGYPTTIKVKMSNGTIVEYKH